MAGEESRRSPRERSTRQFGAVIEELADSEDFRSAQDIHSAMRGRGNGIGLATVYRALQSLVEAGRADVVRTPSGEATFRSCSQSHHHHLVCRWCGRTVEVQGPTVEQWTRAVSEEHDFTDVSHTLELFGTCAACAAAGH